jgi:hypothetical protein
MDASNPDMKGETAVSGVAPAPTEGPAVLAQPTADTFPFPKSPQSSGDALRDTGPGVESAKVVSSRLADARDAAVSTYRHASDATDQHVHQRPPSPTAIKGA